MFMNNDILSGLLIEFRGIFCSIECKCVFCKFISVDGICFSCVNILNLLFFRKRFFLRMKKIIDIGEWDLSCVRNEYFMSEEIVEKVKE